MTGSWQCLPPWQQPGSTNAGAWGDLVGREPVTAGPGGVLAGGEPVTAELVGAASQLDLLIAGNHDAWALGPDRVVARGRDVFRLSSRAVASRHGIDCWHGSPRPPPPRVPPA